ncbi:MAG: hypothetical protein AAF291_10890 [Pseudomonadota bacterium]
MPQGGGVSYTSGHTVGADGGLCFQCSGDSEAFPWLALAPQHPVVIQTQQFWTSFGALMFEGGLEEGQWSALTWMDYALGDQQAGHAVRGIYRRIEDERGPAFALTLFDAQEREIVAMRGRGVVFRNRNFEKWREGSKSEAKEAKPSFDFEYASPEKLNLGDGEFAFVAPFAAGSNRIEALITPENGMPPRNRVISGSGDHVNTTNFGEATRQALCLITGDPAVQVSGGEMTLKRYVELGTPFALIWDEADEGAVRFSVEQLGKSCAEIALTW